MNLWNRNFTFEGLRDPDVREDYFVLLVFIVLYGGDEVSIEGLQAKSSALTAMNYLGERAYRTITI